VDPTVESLEAAEDPKLEEKRKMKREMIQGKPLTSDERKALVSQFERSKTNRHVNLGMKVKRGLIFFFIRIGDVKNITRIEYLYMFSFS